jgi:NADH:ubiquinone oxidoreductase subunit
MGIIDKIRSLLKRESLDPVRQYLKMGEYKGGILVGTDSCNNRYYEIPNFPSQSSNNYRSRYVVYDRPDFDASQISTEW